MNPEEDRALKAQLDEYTRNGWIETAHSAYGAGVSFTKKHDGGLRLCIDYRRLTELTQKVVYPIHRIDECLDSMAGSRVFTKMDLRSGFHQIQLVPEPRERTTFIPATAPSNSALCPLAYATRRPLSSEP